MLPFTLGQTTIWGERNVRCTIMCTNILLLFLILEALWVKLRFSKFIFKKSWSENYLVKARLKSLKLHNLGFTLFKLGLYIWFIYCLVETQFKLGLNIFCEGESLEALSCLYLQRYLLIKMTKTGNISKQP